MTGFKVFVRSRVDLLLGWTCGMMWEDLGKMKDIT